METTTARNAPTLFTPPQTSVEDDPLEQVDALLADESPHAFRDIICLNCQHIISVPVYCGNRFCEVCSRPRTRRIRKRIQFCIDNTPKVIGDRWRFMTLTIANRPDLPAMIKHLTASFRRLRQRKTWQSHVSGGCFVIEVTGHRDSWHAHIHTMTYGNFFPWNQLLGLWKKVSGGQHIDIREVPPKQSMNYITNYITKKMPFTDNELLTVSAALKGFRLFNPFGSWHKLASAAPVEKCGCPKCHGSDWMPLDWYERCPRYSEDWIQIQYIQARNNEIIRDLNRTG